MQGAKYDCCGGLVGVEGSGGGVSLNRNEHETLAKTRKKKERKRLNRLDQY